MRTVLADTSIQQYLEKQLESQKFSFGIIIGQPSRLSKDYVVHLARTPHDSLGSDSSSIDSISNTAKDVESINAELLVDHGLSAVRMIPGGFYVLGIFIVSSNNIFENKDDFHKVKLLLKQLADILKESTTIFACSDEYDNGEKLLLHYAGRRALTCKSIEVDDLTRAGNGRPVEWKFVDKGVQWQQIETIFDTDYVFPLIKRPEKAFDLEENISFTVDDLCKRLNKSLVFFDGEPFVPSEQIENVLKTLKGRKNESQIIQGSIFFPCKEKIDEDESKIIRYEGTLKYSGIVSSKIWVQTKFTIEDIQKFVKADILRSISSRLRLYLDTTTCVESQHEFDFVWVNEPPRRVFFELPSSQIMFSDYLFRGETEETVVVQAKDILDVEIFAENIMSDVEVVQEVDDELTQREMKDQSTTKPPSNSDNTRFMYMLGICLAFGMLLISIGLHFIFNYD